MHLEPQPAESVVHENLDHPRRSVKLVYDSEFIGRSRCSFVFVTDSLLLLAVEKLIHPAEEVVPPVSICRQILIDHADDSDQRGVRGPQASIFMVRVKEDADIAGDVSECRGERISEQGFLCIVLVFVAAAAGVAKIPQITRIRLARDQCKDLGLFRRGMRVLGRGQIEKLPDLHGLESHQAVEKRVCKFPLNVLEAAVRRALGDRIPKEQGLEFSSCAFGLFGQMHFFEWGVLAVGLHAQSTELGLELLLDQPTDLWHPGLDRLLVPVRERLFRNPVVAGIAHRVTSP